ncbi:SDR family NAD(P)-dependent oxidoreductase [Oharaeibacter diazotrophicus]|uniref:Short-subunit dehydrogenase n=1 Tax=Oharaeibacter diazotrophicus TaxID=1920512 RepID=A0A4R6RJL5_9HYPH|nr:SDR family NAD(P)-dependent oxidoreductase [Oharaeibacter diazotrophicus]TDP86821.1 short-subunit dehydrogenase [Oharaeibacter diazotrophicus]BBE71236.1 putative oxidoreductase [Pleomorphomonas sp. SM30]GLS77990.1 short-chain dehydrogenase [Oharaeibacter diazotrophicus]
MSNDAAPGRTIVILGALSAIAEASARRWAAEGAHLVLLARDPERLEAVAADLRVRGARVDTVAADLATVDAAATIDRIVAEHGRIDVALLAYGVLGEQARAERDPAEALRILQTDFTSAAGWCLALANVLERRGGGVLVVVGSVAGDRGRASNYVYGAAKGGLGILVQGIAHRLARSGARAVLVKPGFVDTPMTAHIARKGPLWAKPEAIAAAIVASSRAARGPVVVYAPWFWRWVMLAVRLVPAALFHRTRL